MNGRRQRRSTALTLYDDWADLTEGLGRCEDADACPACREDRPCGVDTWTYHLAGAAVGTWTRNTVISFLPVTGAEVRTQESVWGTWNLAGRGPLADAALWRCHEWWVTQGQHGSAETLAQIAWGWGSRQPRIGLAHLDAVAAGGRPGDLRAALVVANEALRHEPRQRPARALAFPHRPTHVAHPPARPKRRSTHRPAGRRRAPDPGPTSPPKSAQAYTPDPVSQTRPSARSSRVTAKKLRSAGCFPGHASSLPASP